MTDQVWPQMESVGELAVATGRDAAFSTAPGCCSPLRYQVPQHVTLNFAASG